MILQIGPLQHASKLPFGVSSSEIRHSIQKHRRAFTVKRASTSKKEVEYSASIEVGLQTQQGVAQPEDFSINVTKSNISSATRRLENAIDQQLVDFLLGSRISGVKWVYKFKRVSPSPKVFTSRHHAVASTIQGQIGGIKDNHDI